MTEKEKAEAALIDNAATIAQNHHEGIFRKYPRNGVEVPYYSHPFAVATRAACLRLPQPTLSYVIAAALAHDCLEDTDAQGNVMKEEYLEKCTHAEVLRLVKELTNPSKQYDELSREDRKKMDREHIAQISPEAKLLKMIDRTHNLKETMYAPTDFRKLYHGESVLLLEAIGKVDLIDFPILKNEFQDALTAVRF